MASEISLTSKVSITKSGVTVTNATSTKTQNIATTLSGFTHQTTMNVNTTWEDVSLGDVLANANNTADEYMVELFNRETTNNHLVYVGVLEDAGSNIDNYPSLMRPGEPFGPVRMKKMTNGYPKVQVKAAVAGVNKIEVVAGEAGDPDA